MGCRQGSIISAGVFGITAGNQRHLRGNQGHQWHHCSDVDLVLVFGSGFQNLLNVHSADMTFFKLKVTRLHKIFILHVHVSLGVHRNDCH